MDQSFRPRKSLGQNFLVDDNIARKIVRAAEILPEDIVLEIGPGKGALTKHLVGKAKHVVAVELDRRAANLLRQKFEKECAGGLLEIKEEDFLEFDLRKTAKRAGQALRVVGNIPYYITSPILLKAIAQREAIQDLIILVQLEVGKRIVAEPNTKDYGILSVFCQFYGTPKLLFKVPASAFFPRPKVVSALLRLDFPRRPVCDVLDENLFVEVVRTAFGKRRKTLRNSLRYLGLEGLDLSSLHFNLQLRPEQLTLDDFVRLSNLIAKQVHASHNPKD